MPLELVFGVWILTPTCLSTSYLLYSVQGVGVLLSNLKSSHFLKAQLFIEGLKTERKCPFYLVLLALGFVDLTYWAERK